MREISLWLDHYDDIYSDFDSRQYPRRRISEDFLYELKTAFQYKGPAPGIISLFLPAEKRNESAEKMIADSLKNYFLNQYNSHKSQCQKKLRQNIFILVIGVVMMTGTILISSQTGYSIEFSLLKAILEPAGWFFLWASLDFLYYEFRTIKKERNFYRDLTECKIKFCPS